MEKISFLNPEFFWLLLLIPAAGAWLYLKRNQQTATLKISSTAGFKGSKSFFVKLYPFLGVLRLLALTALIVAMARPRTVDVSNKTKTTKGIDIVMAIDVSGSMLAKDLKPNRMEALKKVAASFVDERPNDRIGLVVYASEAYTKTPVTSDKAIIQQAIGSIKYDNVLQDGTGIGMGLATAVNRLKDSKAKSNTTNFKIGLKTELSGLNRCTSSKSPNSRCFFLFQYILKRKTSTKSGNRKSKYKYFFSSNSILNK